MYELIQNLLSDKETGNFTFAPFRNVKRESSDIQYPR